MPRIFVSQALLDRWMTSGRVRLEGDMLRLPAEAGPVSLYLSQAVHIVRIEGLDTDPNGLVGSVRGATELAQMGAEVYDTSVILGECAYAVAPGFLAVPVGAGGVDASFDAAVWTRISSVLMALAAA